MTLAFFSASLVSCSKTDKEKERATTTVFLSFSYASSEFTRIQNDMSKVFDKLKELQYIRSYSGGPATNGNNATYLIFPVTFKQENVLLADTTKVKQELLAKAQKHYEEVIKKVDAFDFNTLFTQDMLVEKFDMDIVLGEKSYPVEIQIQRPLIWDKVWSTSAAASPLKKMSFVKNGKDFTGTLILANDTEIKTETVTRFMSSDTKQPYIRTVDDYRYYFILLAPNKLQLVEHSPDGRTIHQVADKNIIFTPEN